MIYVITQNPEYRDGGKKVKPFYLYDRRDGSSGRRNLAGLHEVRGHATNIDSRSFTDSLLLDKLKDNLKKRSIEYSII